MDVNTLLIELAETAELRRSPSGDLLSGLAVADGPIAPESARDTLVRILMAPDPRPALRALFAFPLGAVILPEVAALDLDQGGRNLHKDNLDHSIRVAAQSPRRLRVRLAALLHDVGKASTRRIAADGTVTFHGHEAVGQRLILRRLQNLGFDASFASEVADLVVFAGRIASFEGATWTDSAVRRILTESGDLFDDAAALARADCTSAQPTRRRRAHRRVSTLVTRAAEVCAGDTERARRPPIDGQRIMEILGVGPGPVVGAARRHLLELSAGAELSATDAETLLRDWWSNQTM